MIAQRKENGISWWRHLAINVGIEGIEENQWFHNANWINSGKVISTTLKLAEKFGRLFSHLFIFRNIYDQGNGSDAVTVTSSKYSVSIH